MNNIAGGVDLLVNLKRDLIIYYAYFYGLGLGLGLVAIPCSY